MTDIESTMIKKYSLLALEKAINYALALDEGAGSKISALENKVIKIIIINISLSKINLN